MNSNVRIPLTAVAKCPCCGTSISLEIAPITTAPATFVPYPTTAAAAPATLVPETVPAAAGAPLTTWMIDLPNGAGR